MSLADWIFPRKCIGCGKEGKYVCESCEVGMWEEEQICPICCRNSRYGLRHGNCRQEMDGLVCHFAYEGMVKRAISEAKYRYYFKELDEVVNKCAELWDRPEFYKWGAFMAEKPMIVPVPLHKDREKERGFNQAEIIAKSLAARHRLSVDSQILFRTKRTEHQVGKSREVRLKAMEGAFQINSKLSFDCAQDTQNPLRILLVDDVWTTGATMRECAKTLKKAFPDCLVWGWVIAR